LRKYGRQYTDKHVYVDRPVEFRRGYSDRTHTLWGIIEQVEHAESLEIFFEKVPFGEVIPVALNLEDAISQAEKILNIQDNKHQPLIGFKVKFAE